MSYLAIPETHPLLVPTGSKARDKLQRRHQEVQVLGGYLLFLFLGANAAAFHRCSASHTLIQESHTKYQGFY